MVRYCSLKLCEYIMNNEEVTFSKSKRDLVSYADFSKY